MNIFIKIPNRFLNILIIFLTIFIFFIFPTNVIITYASANSDWYTIATQQKWYIPNDYETSMNPPACTFREPTKNELSVLEKTCDGVPSCIFALQNWIKLWREKDCTKIGMKIRTLPNGSLGAYFPPKPTSIPDPAHAPTLIPTSTPTSTIKSELINKITKSLSGETLKTIGLSFFISTITTVAVFAISLRVIKKKARS